MNAITFGPVTVLLVVVGNYETSAEFKTVRGSTFYVEETLKLNWFAALNYCAANNMRLLSIQTAEKQQLLQPILENEFYWTSCNALEWKYSPDGNWYWAYTGFTLPHSHWAPNGYETDGDKFCLVIGPDTNWKSQNCYDKYKFICEYPDW